MPLAARAPRWPTALRVHARRQHGDGPTAKLSGQASVVVLARVSKSGNPAPQKGDIEGVSAPVAPGAPTQVVISKIVPEV